MSKVICEICGTAYPDTATECPICGFHRQIGKVEVNLDDLQTDNLEHLTASTERVKGGRFSNKNVKKRQDPDYEEDYDEDDEDYDEEPQYNDDRPRPSGALKTVFALLLVGVIGVSAYIGYRFWKGSAAYDDTNSPIATGPAVPATTVPATTVPAETGIPCTDLVVSDNAVEIRGAGRGWLLGVTKSPEDTTDQLTFTSSDEKVAKVSDSGRITSVGPGTATITITCGDVVKECVVTCSFEGAEVTKPSEAPTVPGETNPAESVSDKGFQLDRTDVTLFKKDETFTFAPVFDGETLKPSEVQWESSDESIVTVEDGKVTALAAGEATVTATYDGTAIECIVRCRFEEEKQPGTNGNYSDSNWKISNEDVTLIRGESFTLELTNDAGEVAKVEWSSSNNGVVEIDGNELTGNYTGMTEVTATIDGKTYTCIVRVIDGR